MLKTFIAIAILLSTTFLTRQSAAAQSIMNIKKADPVHNLNHDFGKQAMTYSDGTTVVYNLGYKPLFINGSLIKADVKTVNDRTLVPIRAVVENLDGRITWDDNNKKVTIKKNEITIEMVIGSTTAKVNGIPKILDVAPIIYDDYSYLPVRFVAENLGANVSYNEGVKATLLVNGVQGNVIVDQPYTGLKTISKTDAVSRIINISNKQYEKLREVMDSKQMEPGERFTVEIGYRAIERNIKNTKVIGEVSRYYVVEGVVYRFFFDKYTGTLYLQGGDSASNWIVENSPDAFFFRGYFAG